MHHERRTGRSTFIFAGHECRTGRSAFIFGSPERRTGRSTFSLGDHERRTGRSTSIFGSHERRTGRSTFISGHHERRTGATNVERGVLLSLREPGPFQKTEHLRKSASVSGACRAVDWAVPSVLPFHLPHSFLCSAARRTGLFSTRACPQN